MGVRGLQTFLERERQVRPIKLAEQIDDWKRKHPGETPLLVIDFYNLCFCLGTNITVLDSVCDGGHQTLLNAWKKLLTELKATGGSLVFFIDLNVNEGKIDEWLRRRNREFKTYIQLYGHIELGLITEYLSGIDKGVVPGSVVPSMMTMAETFGEVHYSFRRECDLEIAQYATRHNALAIISSDTDFLIFEGPWRYWSAKDLHMGPLNQMRTIEFNRNGLATICSLSQHHLPLLATLLTNDFTHDYYDQLVNFHTSLGPMKFVVKNVARYVKKVGSAHLSDLDIRRLTKHAFGEADNKIQRLIRQSLDSYNIDFPPVIIEDPMELKLLNTGMYELYMYYMGEIQDIILGMYDMRDCKSQTNLPLLLTDWALLLTDWAFTLLTKKQFNEDYIIHKEEPIYPEFQLPPLDQLYIQTDTVDDRENTEIRWKILSFIMSLSNQVILALKNLPKNYLVICTALYALVKSELLTAKEADGILYTEYKFNSGEDTRVSDNFSIAGLQSYIQSVPQVDGVYFQKVMEQTSEMEFVERESFFAPIKAYRIYANVN